MNLRGQASVYKGSLKKSFHDLQKAKRQVPLNETQRRENLNIRANA